MATNKLGAALDHRTASSGIGGLVAGLAAANLLPMPPILSLAVEVPLAVAAFQLMRQKPRFLLPAMLRNVALPSPVWRAIAGHDTADTTPSQWPLFLRLAVLLLAIGSLVPVPVLGWPAAVLLAVVTRLAARGRPLHGLIAVPAAVIVLAPLGAAVAAPAMLGSGLELLKLIVSG